MCVVSSSSTLLPHIFLPDRTVRLLGQGTFGKVVEAVDMQTHNRVAIKIIRAIPKYRDASKIEVRVLQKLKEKDPTNSQFVHLLTHSEHQVTFPFPVNASIYSTPSTIATIYA